MNSKFLNLSILILATVFITACAPGSAALQDETSKERAPTSSSVGSGSTITPVTLPSSSDQAAILEKYNYVDPSRVVSTKLLAQALIYFDTNKSSFKNQNVITVVDFSLPSSQKRLHVIDMNTGVVTSLHMAHGKGSDPTHTGIATKFSNTSGSEMSSLGFFKTAETYNGEHGLQMRIDGLSATNSNARARAVVVHGADYVLDSPVLQGRSWGCFAVSMANHTSLIDMIKGGSMIYSGLEK